jgi:hypothetical protein
MHVRRHAQCKHTLCEGKVSLHLNDPSKWGMEMNLHAFLTTARDGVSGLPHSSTALPPGDKGPLGTKQDEPDSRSGNVNKIKYSFNRFFVRGLCLYTNLRLL